MTPSAHLLDRDTEIGMLSQRVKDAVNQLLIPLTVVLVLESAFLSFSERPGAFAFILVSAGTVVALKIWSTGALGLPLLPVLAIQSLVIYGLPIAAGHEIIKSYPPGFVFDAGVEVLIFTVSMALCWKVGMQLFYPSPPVSYALQEVNRAGSKGWSKLGFAMIIGTTAFITMQSLGLTDPVVGALPTGTSSILAALIAVVSASGFFLVSMTVGGPDASVVGKVIFWFLLVANGMLSASEFLLYSVAANLITVAVGFFWGQGRIPWRYLIVSMLCLSFLNTGKTAMRARYWGNDFDTPPPATAEKLPALYAEWIRVSYDAILANQARADLRQPNGEAQAKENLTLLDRIDNLQNLLFVIDAVEAGHIPVLHGATYTLIPPLLVPRILAPNKPRSHEGQILLNVHFGRQDLGSTFSTYIAWGLLPEAYGNFGAVAGSLLVGASIGLLLAWIENLTARKLVVSTEGFLSLGLLMNVMNSFEMVASLLVTETFQSFMIIIFASMPFVRRTVQHGAKQGAK